MGGISLYQTRELFTQLKSNNRAYGYSSNFHSLCLCGVSHGIYLVRVRIKMRRGEPF